MEFLIFYVLFSWIVVYKVFKSETDSASENFVNIIMSLVSGWIVLPLLVGVHLRGDNK